VKAVPPASNDLRKLQHKIVLHFGRCLDAQRVSNAVWALSKQGLFLEDAVVPLREASVSTAASMDEQEVSNSLYVFAVAEAELGCAKEALMLAVLRVADTVNAQAVANTVWAFAKMNVGLGDAHGPLMRAVWEPNESCLAH
jgi:hypothetical protein